MKVFSTIASLALIMALACTQSSQDNTSEVMTETTESIQRQDQLLAGYSAAVAYSGFRSGQHPDRGDGAKNPSDAQILEDLNMLMDICDFRLIRLYDSKQNSQDVLRVIDENELDMKVLLGIWLDAELSAHETCEWLTEPIPDEKLAQNKLGNWEEIQNGIELANKYPDIVVAVNVGNEALVDWNDHLNDPDTVITYVQYVKNAIAQPVTVAENYEWWAKKGAKLAEAVDFLSLHIYPVWVGKDINDGFSYSLANFEMVRDSLPGKTIVITEAGWASVASEFGERASEDKQLQYYAELMGWADENNITTFFFEAFDEDWKGNPDNMMGAEKHWGMFTVDRKPKKVITELFAMESTE